MRYVMMDDEKNGYVFSRAKWEEKAEIEQVYAENWKRLQLFDDRLFRYFYGDGQEPNFIIVRKKPGYEICGGAGYIKCSENEAWISALFVKKGERVTLMPQLLHHIMSLHEFIYMVDLREYTRAIYEVFLRYPVREMEHYYRSSDQARYRIASISDRIIMPPSAMEHQVVPVRTGAQFRECVTEEVLKRQHPYKSIEYLIKRYFGFPYPQYRYDIWGILVDGTRYTTFIVMREQQIDGVRVGRIVDVIGSEAELPGISGFFDQLGKDREYEYIDCLCYGLSEEIMRETGFVLNKGDANIIPNRLEPLVRENDRIFFATPALDDIRIFRADADMDRPNLSSMAPQHI